MYLRRYVLELRYCDGQALNCSWNSKRTWHFRQNADGQASFCSSPCRHHRKLDRLHSSRRLVSPPRSWWREYWCEDVRRSPHSHALGSEEIPLDNAHREIHGLVQMTVDRASWRQRGKRRKLALNELEFVSSLWFEGRVAIYYKRTSVYQWGGQFVSWRELAD